MSVQWERPMIDGQYCVAESGCVEVAPTWEKSTLVERCGNGECVEATSLDGGVLVRDSKLGDDSPVLRFTLPEWKAFREAIKAGQFAYDEQREPVAL